MKTIASALSLGLVAAMALAGGPPKDIANGSIGAGDQTVEMNAQSTKDGARGAWRWEGPGFFLAGTVTAIKVEGDLAVACGVITDAFHPGWLGHDFSQFIDDLGNGSPHGMGDSSRSYAGEWRCDDDLVDLIPDGIRNDAGNWHLFDGA